MDSPIVSRAVSCGCRLPTAKGRLLHPADQLVAMGPLPVFSLAVPVLVVAGPALLKKYGNVVEYIERDGFSVNYKVSTMLEGENLSSSTKSVGLGIVELASTFDDLKPDMVITVADRFETISTAIASSFMNIPLVHIQGGEVTGSIDEKVRHSITKLSDLHLVSSEDAADRLYKMGEHKDSIFVTGCPSIDLAKEILKYNKFADQVKFAKGVCEAMAMAIRIARSN